MNLSYRRSGKCHSISLLPTLVPARLPGTCQRTRLCVFIAGSGSLTAVFTHFCLTSESLISALEPDLERGFYSLNPAALLTGRTALVWMRCHAWEDQMPSLWTVHLEQTLFGLIQLWQQAFGDRVFTWNIKILDFLPPLFLAGCSSLCRLFRRDLSSYENFVWGGPANKQGDFC